MPPIVTIHKGIQSESKAPGPQNHQLTNIRFAPTIGPLGDEPTRAAKNDTRRRRRFSTTDNSTQNVPEGIAINLDVTIADPAKEQNGEGASRVQYVYAW